MRRWRKWSAEDDAELRAAIDCGLAPVELAKRIGRTVKAIRSRRCTLHLPYLIGGRYKKHLATIRYLHWLGKTAAEVAAATGLCVDTVNCYRREMDLPPFDIPARRRSNAWSEDEDARLESAIKARLNRAETARAVGRSLNAVTRRRAMLELPSFKRQLSVRPPCKWQPDCVERLAALCRTGHSYREIGTAFAVSRNAVAGAIHRHLREQANT